MGIKSTHRVYRGDAIQFLRNEGVTVFDSDSNERLAEELEKAWDNDFENYEVVDFERENEPDDDKWHLWK